ncbi:MAG: NUDIX hydrolase [Planctomycetes bacterium]|nr:NUDIX hydrolase [Planctomycetota bacterium]
MNSTGGEIRCTEQVLSYAEQCNPWVKVYFDRVQFPDGKVGRYNRIVESDGRAGVAVLPVMGDTVGLVRQFRYPVGAFMWEIPRGFGDSHDPEVDARRELLEETGRSADSLIALGVVHPNTGILASAVSLFAAVITRDVDAMKSGTQEVTDFRWFSRSDVLNKVGDGTLTDAFTIAAIVRARHRGLI